MSRTTRVLPRRLVAGTFVALFLAMSLVAGIGAAADPYWAWKTPNNTSVVYDYNPWGKMQYLWNVYKLMNDGTNVYDWYVIDAQVTVISAVSLGYPDWGWHILCGPVGCFGPAYYEKAQATGSRIRIDFATSTNEAFYGAPTPDSTSGSKQMTLSVGLQAGQNGAAVTASFSVTYVYPDVSTTRYFNPQTIGSSSAAWVYWDTGAAKDSNPARSSWTVRTLTLIQVKQGFGLSATLLFGGVFTSYIAWWSPPGYPFDFRFFTVSGIPVSIDRNAPSASFAFSPTKPIAKSSVGFSGSGYDPDGDPILSYVWNFGDGTTGSGASVSHAFSSGGTYTVRLTVSDGYNTGTTTRTVTVYTGIVRGYVRDSKGNVLASATVVITDSRGSSQTVYTDASGYYSAYVLPAGTTTLTASKTGYQTATKSVTLSAGQTVQVDFGLKVAR